MNKLPPSWLWVFLLCLLSAASLAEAAENPVFGVDLIDVAGEAASQTSLHPGIRDIKNRGELVVAMVDFERYPFFYDDHGLKGVDADLARGIAAALGVEPVIKRTSPNYDDLIDRVASGEADVAISKLSVTLARAQRVLYTRPYITLSQGLLINRVQLAAARQDATDPVALINRLGGKVGVLADSSYVEFGRELFPDAEIVPLEGKDAVFDAVVDGDVIAVLWDENEIKQFVYQEPKRLIHLRIHMLPDVHDHIAMAVAWDRPGLASWLNVYLQVRQAEWTVDELLGKYERSGE